ncbi:MAG: hypothetical protein M3Z96_05905 [Pseudomonadota bacterium]|nr:hypothetical protein [Pseudomonadota bacterium]
MAVQANSASAAAKGRSRIAIFATVKEAEAAVIDDAAALVNIAAWDELALRVPWGVQPALYARVANAGPVFGGQFLSNGGTVRWQITGTDFYIVQFGPGSDNYAVALINVESFFAKTSGSGRLFFPPTNVRFPRTIYFPIKVYHIEGNASDTILRPKAGAVYDDDVMFRVNVGTDGNWISAYPNSRAGFIGSFQLENDANIDIRGFEFGGSYKIGKITALDFNQICASAPHYTDMITVEDIANLRQRTSPQGWPDRKRATFSSGAIGDGLRIKGVLSSDDPFGKALAILISGCRGGVIEGTINGIIHAVNCSALTLIGGHFETGGLIVEESNVTVSSTIFFNQNENARLPIETVNTQAVNGEVFTLILDDVTFLAVRYREDDATDGLPVGIPPASLRADVLRANGVTLIVRNCARSINRDGTLNQRGRMGIIVAGEYGLVSDWNSKSGALSQGGRIDVDGKVRANITTESESISGFLTAMGNDGFSRWNASSGTYHYACQVLHDTIRMLGHTIGATAVAMQVKGEGGVLLVGTQVSGVTYRFFRGSSAGSYDRYVDIPAVDLGFPYDFGDHLNGFPWLSRREGPVDKLAIPDFYGSVTFFGQNIVALYPSATADTTTTATGTFRIGDEIRFPGLPTAKMGGQISALVRTTGGSGTAAGVDWKMIIHPRA